MSREQSLSRRDILRAGCCTAAFFAMTAAMGRLNMISCAGGRSVQQLSGAGVHFPLRRERQ
jgi:hypothetical protein